MSSARKRVARLELPISRPFLLNRYDSAAKRLAEVLYLCAPSAYFNHAGFEINGGPITLTAR